MPLRAVPFGAESEVHWGSDISTLSFSEARLEIYVSREVGVNGEVSGLKIAFFQATAFRYLDELDLARYWSSEHFPRGFHVLEVLEGGWLEEETQLQGFANHRREWLVVTGNACVSVFSSTDPQVQNASWQRGA
jgi:hypothetical protein